MEIHHFLWEWYMAGKVIASVTARKYKIGKLALKVAKQWNEFVCWWNHD